MPGSSKASKTTKKAAAAPATVEPEPDTPVQKVQIDPDAIANAVTALEARNRPTVVEPDEDEVEFGSEMVFVRTGLTRFYLDGTKHILRRPTLGELHDLETSKDSGSDELQEFNKTVTERTNEIRERAKEIEAEAKKLDAEEPGSLRRGELDEETARIVHEAMREQASVMRKADEIRELWWKEVFAVLTPPGHGEPPYLPSWVGDPGLPDQMIIHWRSSPLAYGNR